MCVGSAGEGGKRVGAEGVADYAGIVKPSKAGVAHEKAESVFVDAMRRAKWPTYYIGMTSLSGKARALFLTSFESFDA